MVPGLGSTISLGIRSYWFNVLLCPESGGKGEGAALGVIGLRFCSMALSTFKLQQSPP
jgi:hypothetical protein